MTIRSTSFQASAGTGKTWQVTHLYAALLLGERFPEDPAKPAIFDGDPLDCQDILMLTFARNAAAEMRTRIVAGLEDEIAEGDVERKERCWKLLRSLASAHISTIHAFAQRLVTEHALQAGVSPGLSVMDETLSDEMFRELVESAVLAELKQAGSLYGETLRMLCRSRGLSHPMNSSGVIDVVMELIRKARARALDLSAVGALVAGPVPPTRADLEAARMILVDALAGFTGTCNTAVNLVADLDGRLDGMKEDATSADVIAAAAEALSGSGQNRAYREGAEEMKAELIRAKDALGYIAEHDKHVLAAQHLGRLVPFVADCAKAYQDLKQERGVVDYDDLILSALKLVQKFPEIMPKFKVIIVDEAQDNSSIQNDLVEALSKAAGAAIVLCGDWKQSIHTWRAAMPGGMKQLAEKCKIDLPVPLTTSYRSQKDMVGWINEASAQDCVLGSRYDEKDILEERDIAKKTAGPNVEVLLSPWEYGGDLAERVRYQAKEPGRTHDGTALVPRFSLTQSQLKKVCADDAESAKAWQALQERYEKRHALEARAVARRIKLLCESPDGCWRPTFMWDGQKEKWVKAGKRRYEYRDVLILLRASSRQDIYETALREVGIRYTTDGKGKGFYYRQEVQDICSLVAWLAWPCDVVSLTALLRSPFVSLSDPAIAVLAASREHRADALCRAIEAGDDRAQELAGELKKRKLKTDARAYLRANHLLRRLRQLAGRLTVAELVREAMTLTGFDAAVAGQFHGSQKLSNARKLLSLIQDMERRENLDLQALAKWLAEQVNNTSAPDAVVFDPKDNAVRISTVHAAKGLTSPVVVIPDLRRKTNRDKNWCMIHAPDDDGGCSLAAKLQQSDRTGGKTDLPSCDYKVADDANKEREDWEAKRLFYVGITRPRDLLILSGETISDEKSTSWRTWVNEWIAAALPDPARISLCQARGYGEVEKACSKLEVNKGARVATGGAVEAAARSVKSLEVAEQYRLPVTTLTAVPQPEAGEKALLEYRGTRLAGLTPAWMRARNADEAEDGGPAVDYAEMGTAGHAVLETFNFAGAGSVEERLQAAVAAAGIDPAVADEMRPRLLAAAKHLDAQLEGAEDIIRELPFVACFEHDGARCLVDGKMDLLYFKDGVWHIVDYKFANASESKLVSSYALQLNIYREAWLKKAGVKDVTMQLLGISDSGELTAVELPADRAADQTSRQVISAARVLSGELGQGPAESATG